jgi:membrane protein DedA with SNARE-associated domain
MEEWLQNLFKLMPDGGVYYSAIAVVAFLESLVAAGVIIPGSSLIVFAGFLALHGRGDIGIIISVAVIGAFLGDLFSFWLGARFGERLLFTKTFQKRKKLLRQAEKFFVVHGGKSVFFGRFVGPVRGFIPFVAGSAQMNPKAFTLYATISAILWGLAYPGLGYLAGYSWANVETWTTRISLMIGLFMVITIFIIVIRRRLR